MRSLIIFLLISVGVNAQGIYSNNNSYGIVGWWLPGTSVMTDSSATNYIKAATDISKYSNNVQQTLHSLQPTDHSTYWLFAASSLFGTITNSLSPTQNLTTYCQINTTSTTSFAGLGALSYTGTTTGGWGMFSNSGGVKPQSEVNCSKTNADVTGTTTINDGSSHKIYCTTQCSKLYNSYSASLAGGEEPSVIKVGGVWYMYRDSGRTGIYVDSSSSPYFNVNHVRRQITAYNCGYGGMLYHNGTYFLTEVDFTGSLGTGLEDSIILFTSTHPTTGFVRQGVLFYIPHSATTEIADCKMTYCQDSFKLYYSNFTALSPIAGNICVCTSKSGTAGTFLAHGVVIPNGTSTAFDFNLAADADPIINPDSSITLFYTGYNAANVKQEQGYAIAANGMTFTKYSGNPIHYFSGQSYENGIYGPNEPSFVLDAAAGPGGISIWRCYYRCNNTTAPYLIGYSEYNADPSSSNHLPYCGNESIVTNIYVDGSLNATTTITGAMGLDYILPPSSKLWIGGNGSNTNYFTGSLYDMRIYNKIKINF